MNIPHTVWEWAVMVKNSLGAIASVLKVFEKKVLLSVLVNDMFWNNKILSKLFQKIVVPMHQLQLQLSCKTLKEHYIHTCHVCVLHWVLVNWVYHSVKVFDCMCLLSCERAHEPLRVPEPAPWISVVGLSKHEQSRIKSILILARQEPLLLLGDMSTDREEKREQPHLLLLLSSLLSHSFAPSSYSTSFSPLHCLSFSSLILLLHCLMLASLTSPTQQ